MLRRLDEKEYPHQELTERIIGAAIAVHSALGPGFLESFYENALLAELRARELSVQQQVSIPVLYRGLQIGKHVADLIVEGTVVVELKHVEEISRLHRAQVLSTLRAADLEVGLLINFNVVRLKDGVARVVHTNSPSAPSAPQRPDLPFNDE